VSSIQPATELLALRVTVLDVWDEFRLSVPDATTVATLKARVLAEARVIRDPDAYQVKFRGAAIVDESKTLVQLGIVPNAALIILSRRRRPVR
jgi:hypothetical protein